MDSMRSLNSSLPSSKSRGTPPPDLLQAFRSAALSVTNLYKSAAADQASSRQAGYQDALEDLLKFLDQENLGLQDGEGWRIRQWATQHYDGGNYQQQSEDDEEIDSETRQQSSANTIPTQQDLNSTDVKDDQETTTYDDPSSSQTPAIFHFSGGNDGESGMEDDDTSSSQPTNSSSSPLRLEVVNRSRQVPKHQNGRQHHRSNHRDFTFTAGTKRKLNFPDFFDISNIPERRDGNGVSKKGRLA